MLSDKTNTLVEFDKKFFIKEKNRIFGIDEAGRGCLAGPLVCASVSLPLKINTIIDGVNDSKKLSPKKREKLFPQIINKAFYYKIKFCFPEVIDKINIYQATLKTIQQLVSSIENNSIVLIDAMKIRAANKKIVSIEKGDSKSYNIAAASILAKVVRDRYMLALSKKYPRFLFEKHKGYATKQHKEIIKTIGRTIHHRESYWDVKKYPLIEDETDK